VFDNLSAGAKVSQGVQKACGTVRAALRSTCLPASSLPDVHGLVSCVFAYGGRRLGTELFTDNDRLESEVHRQDEAEHREAERDEDGEPTVVRRGQVRGR
jgi:hypothetical protein